MNLDKHNVADVVPATPLQQGMLYHALAAQDPAMYLEQYGFSVHGDLDIERYRTAWQQVLDHQPMLRTSFHWEGLGKAYQVVHKRLEVSFEHIELSHLAGPQHSVVQDKLRAERRAAGFSLNRAPLFTVTVVTLAKSLHKIWLTLHHLLADGWSLYLLLAEVGQLYQHPLGLPAPAVPFRRYCEWLQAQDQDSARRWWQDRLGAGGFTGKAPLVEQSRTGSSTAVDYKLNEAESARLQQGSRRQGLTESTLFNAAWSILLRRYLRQDRLVFGYTVSTRPAEIDGIERMLGLLLNVLPVTVDLNPEQEIEPWLQALQQQLIADRQHDYLPLSELQRLAGTAANQGLFQTLLVWENQPGSSVEEGSADSLRVVHDESYELNHYPLMLAGYPGSVVRLRLNFRERALSHARALDLLQQMADIMLVLAEGGPRKLGDLIADRIMQPLPTLSLDAVPTAIAPSLWQRILELATANPSAPQLDQAQPAQSFTRNDLVLRAQSLARRLAASLPADRSAPLALLLWPGIDYVSAILAALYLGRPWLALDPRRPVEGLGEQLAYIQPAALLSEPSLWPEPHRWEGPTIVDLSAAETGPVTACVPPVVMDEVDCVCMVLTSGSTGRPKCVSLPLRALRQRLGWMQSFLPASPEDSILLKTSPAFVDAICEVLGPLISGYRMVAPTPEQSHDLGQWPALLTEQAITRLVITPSVLEGLLRVLAEPVPSVHLLQVSGERFPSDLLERGKQRFPNARILNLYGSSEVMADACAFDCSAWQPAHCATVPLGKLLPGALGAILDEGRHPLPEGAIGELFLGGDCLAIGYHANPDATDAKFREMDGLPGRPRMYATGDLVALGEDGQLHYHGRADHQIKLNGMRIEPGEIESLLKSRKGVDDAALACHHNAVGQAILTAHIASQCYHKDPEALVADLQVLLSRQLPSGQMPRHWQVTTDLPRNASGKLDRRALRYLDAAVAVHSIERVAPHTDRQQRLHAVWQQVLGQDAFGIDDDFFALGGSSISMTQLCFAVRKAFHVPFPIRGAFEAPSIRQQADLIQQYQDGAQPVADRGTGRPQHHDLHIDAASADHVLPLAGEITPWPQGAVHVFLSGAQGFINAWLLARLLDDPTLTVSCLAPGSDAQSAWAGLVEHLSQFGLWSGERGSRLRIVAGDLGQPRFGLSEQDWQALAEQCQVLFHTGVAINFVAPYAQLRATNALSTATMLDLATTARAKPLHFVGSLGVVDHSRAAGDSARVREDDALLTWRGLPTGYLQARWVSDTMIRRAIERGVPCSVMRMTTVSGDTDRHQANSQDMMWQLIKLAMTVGIIPDTPRPIDLVPVDRAVEAVIALARSASTLGQAWHVSNPRIWKWAEVAALLRSKGYPVHLLSGEEWSQRFGRVAMQLGEQPEWQKVLPLLGDAWQEHKHFFELDKHKTLERLRQLDSALPPMDEQLLWQTVERFFESGFLPRTGVAAAYG
ncbi:amino acid adenylation protein [Cupriavidus basilensis OR16]|uniref:Amino acid adenylation protein n=1 Tax=Cupriavidus basilensis OR16 TaxID=1127483 RepID=H1SA26_9BURK|nr:thioester reductase domain-containing protein [Cupriavidus basilensis]EHP40575.1 amino acid adenylation protein [Cupriavidus basilensis OR16]